MMKTRVKFVLISGEVLAIFTDIVEVRYKDHIYFLSYMHIGQHGECCNSLLQNKSATPEQYATLKKELESEPFNYELEVVGE